MIQKVVIKKDLKDFNEVNENLAFWLTKSQAERKGVKSHVEDSQRSF
jgi:hypothetical protein